MTDSTQSDPGTEPDQRDSDSKRTAIIIASVAGIALLIIVAVGLFAWISGTNERVAELEERAAEPESMAASETPDAEESTTPDSGEDDESAADGDATEGPESSDADPPTGVSGRELVLIDVTEWLEEPMLTVDYLQFLTGDEAADAASARGDESPPPNDYYIVNDNPRLRTYPVDRTIRVTLVTTAEGFSDPDGYEVDFGLFYDGLQGMSGEVPGMWDTPYWITIEDGTITAIEAQYLP